MNSTLSSRGWQNQLSAVRQLPQRVLLLLIRAYQLVLSPLLGANCRFYPSCSHYAQMAISQHGAVRGLGLALRRLLRCHPFSAGGVDLPPEPDPK